MRNQTLASNSLLEPEHLVGEVIRLFSILPTSEQRLLIASFSKMALNPTDDTVTNSPVDTLTVREKDVLILLARGYTRREIGGALTISINTAARHIANIYTKLDISTSAEAVKFALDSELIT